MASPEVIWQQHNPVGAVYCHMLAFHSEHSPFISNVLLLSRGAHIPPLNWNWHHCVFNHSSDYLFLYNQKSVCERACICPHYRWFVLSFSLPWRSDTALCKAVLRLLQRSNMASCTATVSLSTVRSLAIDRTSPPTEPHFTSPATRSVHRDNIMKHDSWEWD